MKANPIAQKTPEGGNGAKSKQVQVRIDGETMENVERIASANHLSVADVIRIALRTSIPSISENGLTLKPAA